MKLLAQSTIRKQNILSILRLLTAHSPRTRQALAEATGLSLMSVTNLVDQLKACQVLDFLPAERENAKSAAGRKADHISLSGARHAWLLLDLSGKVYRITLLGFNLCTLLEKSSAPTETDDAAGLISFLEKIRGLLPDALGDRALVGAAVVTPGPYDIAGDTVYSQRRPQLNGIRIKELLCRHLGDYSYYVDEDVKFAVRAFSSLIAQEHCELLYYLFIGESVGGAAVHSGSLLRGLNATAGDAGRLAAPGGAAYESLLSLSAFAQKLDITRDDADVLSAELRVFAQKNPDRYLSALRDAAKTTADMLSGVLWLLDPSHIVIDCRYAAPFEKEFMNGVLSGLQQHFQTSRTLPVILPAPDSMSSVLRGAVQALQHNWVERIVP